MTDLSAPSEPITLHPEAHAQLFTDARTANTFTDEPVTDEQLRAIFELAKFPPTAANTQPLRVLFVRQGEARERLVARMNEGNQAKTRIAPVVAVLAVDTDFHEFIPKVFPVRPEMRDHFAADPEGREQMARFNAALQIGYFLLAVRAAVWPPDRWPASTPLASITSSSRPAVGSRCWWSISASPGRTPGSPACPAWTTRTSSGTPESHTTPQTPASIAVRSPTRAVRPRRP